MRALAISHRGWHKNYYENTLNAFKEAASMDFYGIETDIHLTKDNYWVVHHDADFMSDGKKYVISELAKDELINLPLDNEQNDQQAFIPLFEDYFKICIESGKRPIIEIKPKNPSRKYLRKLCKHIDKVLGLEKVTFIAFYPWPLIKLRLRYGKRLHLQMLIEPYMFLINWAKFFRMDIDVSEKLLTKEIVEKFHKKKLKVNVWTIDTEESLRRFEEMGVDYITTNVFNQKS